MATKRQFLKSYTQDYLEMGVTCPYQMHIISVVIDYMKFHKNPEVEMSTAFIHSKSSFMSESMVEKTLPKLSQGDNPLFSLCKRKNGFGTVTRIILAVHPTILSILSDEDGMKNAEDLKKEVKELRSQQKRSKAMWDSVNEATTKEALNLALDKNHDMVKQFVWAWNEGFKFVRGTNYGRWTGSDFYKLMNRDVRNKPLGIKAELINRSYNYSDLENYFRWMKSKDEYPTIDSFLDSMKSFTKNSKVKETSLLKLTQDKDSIFYQEAS